MLITPAVALAAFTGAAPAPTPASALVPAVSSAGQPAPAGQQLTTGPVPAGSVRVTVSLAAADPAGLLRAAHLPSSSDVAGRAARLRALAPTGAARGRVTGYLHAHGLTVASSDAWTVTATGPDSAAEQVFGTRLTRLAGGRVAATPAVLPAGLRGDVVAVTGLDTRPVFHHHATPGAGYGPADLASAYSATTGRGAGTTVGTVQFSGWTPGEAASYAQAENIPLGAGQIQTVPVGITAGDPSRAKKAARLFPAARAEAEKADPRIGAVGPAGTASPATAWVPAPWPSRFGGWDPSAAGPPATAATLSPGGP